MSDNTDEVIKQPILNQKQYDVTKWVVLTVFPAFSALYAGLAALFHFPGGLEVTGTIALVSVFIGSVLQFSSARFKNLPTAYQGELKVNYTDPNEETFKLELNDHWDQLAKNNDDIRIKVTDTSAPFNPDQVSGK